MAHPLRSHESEAEAGRKASGGCKRSRVSFGCSLDPADCLPRSLLPSAGVVVKKDVMSFRCALSCVVTVRPLCSIVVSRRTPLCLRAKTVRTRTQPPRVTHASFSRHPHPSAHLRPPRRRRARVGNSGQGTERLQRMTRSTALLSRGDLLSPSGRCMMHRPGRCVVPPSLHAESKPLTIDCDDDRRLLLLDL